jgi:hypothetical protein
VITAVPVVRFVRTGGPPMLAMMGGAPDAQHGHDAHADGHPAHRDPDEHGHGRGGHDPSTPA